VFEEQGACFGEVAGFERQICYETCIEYEGSIFDVGELLKHTRSCSAMRAFKVLFRSTIQSKLIYSILLFNFFRQSRRSIMI
jgi:hypothetical protein